jgi:adenine-specific DNA methylase
MPVEHVREQLTAAHGGTATARLVAVATAGEAEGRSFRAPTARDVDAAQDALRELEANVKSDRGQISLLPEEQLPPIGTLGFRVQRYGMLRWRDLFTPRQLVAVSTLVRLVREAMPDDRDPGGLGVAVRSCLALVVDRLCDYLNTGCSWNPSSSTLPHLFTRQALPIIWDFGEANPLGGSSGDWSAAVEHVLRGLRNAVVGEHAADVGRASARNHPLPTDCAHIMITDPPYYDAIPYADLSDFFYVWLRRMLHGDHPDLFRSELVPRDDECVVNRAAGKNREYYRRVMTGALAEARRITRPDGIGVVIFAHKSTAGWEDLLAAMLEAGWIITASWPIDTENASRLRARNSAVLASSIHLVCRPRERPDGTLITDTVGDWRDVLGALPGRIKDWMPRLAREGIVGADAIFACLGPALELFSRYALVEKASGQEVKLKEYLEHVWAAVAKEALAMIFKGADATGFEEDARLTAMWLWTLSAGGSDGSGANEAADEEPSGDDEDEPAGRSDLGGFVLEYDAARKIAQGLGAHLEALSTLIKVRGSRARLLPVAERTRSLFQKGETTSPLGRRRVKRKNGQLSMGFVADLEEAEESGGWGETGAPQKGETVLDRVHQSMILFGAGRGEALKRFLVDERVGSDVRIWRLADALSALYPLFTDEKRWVDGVLARKKGLGF